MNRSAELKFIEFRVPAFLDECRRLAAENSAEIELVPYNNFAKELVAAVSEEKIPVRFRPSPEENSNPGTTQTRRNVAENQALTTFLMESEPQKLSELLMEFVDRLDRCLVAPITEHYYLNKPLFLISIPKAGTHLLYRLVELFGYAPGIFSENNFTAGTWYCVENSNSHTKAKDFFIDSVRQAPFGNRLHPFPSTPSILIYRNPLDIVVSEANYDHKTGKSLFQGYLSQLSFQERLLKLIDDPSLLGSIRERVNDFAAWLEFPNVIPISFEELVGPHGGGDRIAQLQLIWSLQLKLHIPGQSEVFASQVFDESSPTFHAGQIGSYRRYFFREAYKKFGRLPQNFMNSFGYKLKKWGKIPTVPHRTEEFRKRLVSYSEADFDDTPVVIEYDYLGLGYNIVRFQGQYFGIPFGDEVDLTQDLAENKSGTISGPDLIIVKRKVLAYCVLRNVEGDPKIDNLMEKLMKMTA